VVNPSRFAAKKKGASVAARKKHKMQSSSAEASVNTAQQIERLIRLAALFVVKGEAQPEKIKMLSGDGFTNSEIAGLLGVTANAVNVALFRSRN
jgi:hypothetical protein